MTQDIKCEGGCSVKNAKTSLGFRLDIVCLQHRERTTKPLILLLTQYCGSVLGSEDVLVVMILYLVADEGS